MTGALTSLDIIGRKGIILRDQWNQGAKSYLGLGVSNFPNLFTITGPGSPSVLSNMMPSIEQHVNWIADCIGWMIDNNKNVIESSLSAEEEWMELVNEIAGMTIFKSTDSWYSGSNIDSKAKGDCFNLVEHPHCWTQHLSTIRFSFSRTTFGLALKLAV